MSRVHARWAAVALAVVASGCGTRGSADAGGIRRDSAGVAIIEFPAPGPAAALTVPAAPVLDIGSLDGDHQLYRVVGAQRLSDGRIAIANAGSGELFLYDTSGRREATVGGEGEGPGEFAGMLGLERLPGDTLRVWDSRQRRFSTFLPDGTFLGSVNLQNAVEGASVNYLGVVAPGLTLVLIDRPPPIEDLGQGGVLRRSLDYWVYENGTPRGAVLSVATADRLLRIGREDGEITSVELTGIPFAASPQVVPGAGRIHVVDGEQIDLSTYRTDGRLERITRVATPPVPVTDGDIERWLRNGDPTPRQLQARRERYDGLDLPAFQPRVRNLVIDRAGRPWIERFRIDPADPSRWLVVDGDRLSEVELPAGFRPLDIGEGYLLGAWTDELGVEQVWLLDVEEEVLEGAASAGGT